ncbi:LacI family DNA-binding transcriptional regulator [Variovorax sp. J31P179]|uniref:LacI family DNA-binding transcriptional regulator n=1 Tax=Variovorax sp. J31P179 TaxID=3053508 RepID=UPI0025755599|nr:LacI family DNA-binding transcriptional regulator [Variovorax sp. J31P179]MDM0084703.1 LacI family DNA-binding transcriptional regulator [Variovorax sp. J31P179]
MTTRNSAHLRPIALGARPVATLREVAKLAGVSMMSVSRAINSPHQVSAATLKLVTEAISNLGYVPNLVAGGLRASRSYLVVALVPTTTGPLFGEMIHSLTEALDARGYQVMLGEIGYARSREDELLRAIVGRRPDGIVLTGVMHSAESRRMLLTSGIPIVETWDFTRTPIDMLVGLSHERLGAEVCRFLHTRGRRRLALVSGDDERAARRKDGFVKAAKGLSLRSPVVHFGHSPTTHAEGRDGLAKLLVDHPETDAVFCSSDMLALGVLTEARLRGINVPEQLSVVGFGDIDFAETVSPSLTTVRIDGTRIGQTAAQFIADRAEGRIVEQPIVNIGFSIVQRESA